MQLSGVRPSVCLSHLAAAHPLLRVCCCGHGGQEISIDYCTAGESAAAAAAPQHGAQQQMRVVPRCQLT